MGMEGHRVALRVGSHDLRLADRFFPDRYLSPNPLRLVACLAKSDGSDGVTVRPDEHGVVGLSSANHFAPLWRTFRRPAEIPHSACGGAICKTSVGGPCMSELVEALAPEGPFISKVESTNIGPANSSQKHEVWCELDPAIESATTSPKPVDGNDKQKAIPIANADAKIFIGSAL